MTSQIQNIQIPVRELIERTHKAGDLHIGFTGTGSPIDGIRAHKKVQKSRGEKYQSEVQVEHVFETGQFNITLTGRIDGVDSSSGKPVVEEIKSTRKDFNLSADAENLYHWGQLKCYAFIYAFKNELEEIETRLTYYNLDTRQIKEVEKTFTLKELGEFVQGLIDALLAWIELSAEWELKRDESINLLEFPYPEYRLGQRDMAVHVFQAIKNNRQLLAQAPTGIGKTMAALFPSIKAMGQGEVEKIFYLTARTTGQNVAEKTIDEMRKVGLAIKSLTITAKDKICFKPDANCNGEECEYARGYYDRIDNAVMAALSNDGFTREVILKEAGIHMVCPFEFSLDLSLLVDVIICDYNYAFDPKVYLRRFFLQENRDYVFLVDEAHNLVDRARDMYSAQIKKQPFVALRRQTKEHTALFKSMGKVNSWLVKAKKKCKEAGNNLAEKEAPEEIYPQLEEFVNVAEAWLAAGNQASFREDLLTVYFDAVRFLKVAAEYDETYITCIERFGRDLGLKLFCMDPSSQLGQRLKKTKSSIFYSATMTPPDYFLEAIGCDDSARQVLLPSPFPSENLCLMLLDRVSTKYKDREQTLDLVADAVASMVQQKKGNYLVFFPSYKYMTMVHEEFMQNDPGSDILIQKPGMTEDERDEFLGTFSKSNSNTLVGFAVMGGIFGEAIDLVGDKLTGAVIISVGLPAISLERELIREYFAAKAGAGFEYSYMYPGINRVLQAAGRVIRTENDKGIVMLVDQRFPTQRYRSLFPDSWQPILVNNAEKVAEVSARFWEENND